MYVQCTYTMYKGTLSTHWKVCILGTVVMIGEGGVKSGPLDINETSMKVGIGY
jgi:hypothetical protein